MTLISWVMLIVGIAIGVIISSLIALREITLQTDMLRGMNEFTQKYARLCDEQYNNLDKYIDRRLDSITDCVTKLCDICQSSNDDNFAFTSDISKLVTNQTDKISKTISAIHNSYEDLCEREDERWNLIRDYIVNENIKKVITNTMEDKENEHEDLEKKNGTSESRVASYQETEQAEVFSGETDRELVQCELEADRICESSETTEEET